MRLLILLALSATPALAWDFTPAPVCTLQNGGGDPDVRVTHDGTTYAIHLRRAGGWPEAPVFRLRFAPKGPVIATDRHVVDGETLTVTDSGFGNVLNGLQYNATAWAEIGALSIPVDLSGAAGPVEAFRTCRPGPAV